MITTIVLGSYSLTSSLIFLKYLQNFLKDTTTANSDSASWSVLILASLFWPISLPLSKLERNVQKAQSSYSDSNTQIDLIYFNREHQNYSNFKFEKIKAEKIEA